MNCENLYLLSIWLGEYLYFILLCIYALFRSEGLDYGK